MARKKVLEGGKRDEIIGTAMKLFFEHGYEATSVRMIMHEVGGEIGMFYHYFKSKDLLFDVVVERFFQNYRERFGEMLSGCSTREDFVNTFLPMYENYMKEFGQIRGKVHWTVQAAMHDGTLELLRPLISTKIDSWGKKSCESADILAGQLLYGLSATIHSPVFEKMKTPEKKRCIIDYVGKVLD